MKKLILFIIVLIVVGVGAFYSGMKYGQSARLNLSPEQRQQRLQQMGAIGAGVRGGRAGDSGFASGEVISKDDKSVTIKMQDGSSKIIFFSDSTQISKTAAGSVNDIEIGKQIMATGSQNSDGSYTAKIIQLSPRLLNPSNSE